MLKSLTTLLRAFSFERSGSRCLFLAMLGGLILISGCQNGFDVFGWFNKGPAMPSATDIAPGIDEEMLIKARLHEQWSSRIPLGRSIQLAALYCHGKNVYALDSRNVLTVLDAEKGTIIWSRIMAPPKVSSSAPYYYNGLIVWAFGTTIIQIRESDGSVVQELPLEIEISTDVARNEDRFFLGSTDRRFYSLRLSDGVPMWHDVFLAEPIGAVAVDEGNVYFTTREKALYVSTTEDRDVVWKARANGDLVGVTVDGGQCFLPSADTALRCFDAKTGKLIWQYLAGGALADVPVITPAFCYQPIQYKSLICLNRNDGTLVWELKDGREMIAENGPITYIMTHNQEIALMDNSTGRRMILFYVPQIDLYAVNRDSAVCYLARRDGTVWAYIPDVVHSPIAPKPSPKAEPATSEIPSPAAPAAPTGQP